MKFLSLDGLTNYTSILLEKIKNMLNNKADKNHTHNYAGSSSAGGVATEADKLDGYHVSNLCLSVLTPSTNMNEVTASGAYRINSGNTNAPSGSDWGQLLVVHGGGDTIAQLIFDFTLGRCWIRTGNSSNVGGSGSWTEWRSLYTSQNLTYGTSTLTAGSSSLATGNFYFQYE
jgi:hypothetical protein